MEHDGMCERGKRELPRVRSVVGRVRGLVLFGTIIMPAGLNGLRLGGAWLTGPSPHPTWLFWTFICITVTSLSQGHPAIPGFPVVGSQCRLGYHDAGIKSQSVPLARSLMSDPWFAVII